MMMIQYRSVSDDFVRVDLFLINLYRSVSILFAWCNHDDDFVHIYLFLIIL